MVRYAYTLVGAAAVAAIAFFTLQNPLAPLPEKLELTSLRTEFSTVYWLPNDTYQMESWATPQFYKDGESFAPIDLRFEDRGSFFAAEKGVYKLQVNKDFDSASGTVRFVSNFKDQKHVITYSPSFIAWVDQTNPSDYQVLTNARDVACELSGAIVACPGAFGPNTSYEVHLNNTGFTKYVVFNSRPNITPRTANDRLVFFTEYTGNVARFMTKQGEWDKNSYYIANDAITLEDADGREVYIPPAIIEDMGTGSSSLGIERIPQIFTRINGKLYQGKVLPRNFMRDAVYPVRADSQTEVFASNDTFITGFQPTTNKNSDGRIIVGDFGGGDNSRGLLRFTLPSDPNGSGSVIDLMELELYYYDGNGTTVDINVYEDSGNTPSTAWVDSQATWNVYSSGNNWTASGALSDFSSTIIDTTAVLYNAGVDARYYWQLVGTGSTNPITVTWGDTLNLLVRAPSSASENRYFEDTESAGTSTDPKLIITYSLGSTEATTTPATVISGGGVIGGGTVVW